MQMQLGFATRLAALYAAIFVMNGVQLPFFPVWLKAKGLDAGLIGVVLAVPMVVRVLAIPLATRAADRRDALRGAIIVASFLSVAAYALLGLAESAVAILLVFTAASLVFTPLMPLIETYALKGLGERGRAYGPVRLWGSAAFILGTFGAGFAADTIPARQLIWLIVAASALMALVALALSPVSTAHAAAEIQSPRRSLLRDPVFLTVMVSASLIQASHAVYYGFSALAWRAEGYDGTAIAALWAIGVIAEIVLFALHGRLPVFVTPARLLIIGGFGGALRWAAMAFDPPGYALPVLQALHALSFGAAYLGALMFISHHAPPGRSATAQGYLAVALGLGMAVMIALSGWLYAAVGSLAYGAMALAAVAGGVLGGVAHRAVMHDPVV